MVAVSGHAIPFQQTGRRNKSSLHEGSLQISALHMAEFSLESFCLI